MGKYDIPATIDFILNLTNVKKLTYIGHSQGTTQLFAAMSNDIEYYNSKLNGFVALGPVTNLKYSSSWLIQFAIYMKIDSLASWLGVKEFLRGPEYQDSIVGVFCKYFSYLCDKVLGLIADNHPEDDDMLKFEDYMDHFPSGTSIKSLQHFAQINRGGTFSNYDYGKDENKKKYGQATPPIYDVEKIKNIPICMIYGDDDHLSGEKDNLWLKEKLEKNNALYLFRQYNKMGHLTYFIPKENRFLNDTLDCIRYFQQNKN